MTLLSIRSLGIAAALLIGVGLAAGPVSAQQGSVAGQVTDKSNQQPVAGAVVLVAGTSLQARTGRSPEEIRGFMERTSPQGRLMTAEEVAAAALFLCGEAARGITGQAIVIDGGGIQV